jgi:hypothetical protein
MNREFQGLKPSLKHLVILFRLNEPPKFGNGHEHFASALS